MPRDKNVIINRKKDKKSKKETKNIKQSNPREKRTENNDTRKKEVKQVTPVNTDIKRLNPAPDLLKVGTKQYIFKFDPSKLNTKDEGKRIAIVGAS